MVEIRDTIINRSSLTDVAIGSQDPMLQTIHEADGIYYDGDIENFKWQMRILPGCDGYYEKGFALYSLGGRNFSSFSKSFSD